MWWAGCPVTTTPLNVTRPEAAGTSPETVRARVLLPAPFAPRMAVTEPAATSSDRSKRAWEGP